MRGTKEAEYEGKKEAGKWANRPLSFGFKAGELKDKWKNYNLREEVIRSLSQSQQSLTLANGRSGGIWNVSAQLIKYNKMTMENYVPLDNSWACVGKINAIIKVYYSSIQAAAEYEATSSEAGGVVARPVCGDGGQSMALEGLMAQATEVAMNQAAKKLDKTCTGTRCGTAEEYTKAGRDLAKAYNQVMENVPQQKPKSYSGSTNHRRRRSFHRRRRSNSFR